MINPENSVKELLYGNDCVIIPDFGGFIKRDNPTVFDKFSHTIKPKGKTIFFNVALKENDGLLANYIARQKQVSYQEAIELLAEWVDFADKEISLIGRLKFGNLGNFFVNAEGKKWFAPNNSINFSKETFGLDTIVAKAIIETIDEGKKKEEQAEKRKEETIKTEELVAIKPKKKRKYLAAAVISLFVIAAGASSYFIVGNDATIEFFQKAGIMSVSDSVKPEVKTEIETPEIQIEEETEDSEYLEYDSEDEFLEDENYIESEPEQEYYSEEYLSSNSNEEQENLETISQSDAQEQIVQENSQDAHVVEDVMYAPEGEYTILAGAFLYESNAQRRMEELKDNNIEVMPSKPENSRLVRIQCGRFMTKEDAEAHLSEIQKVVPKAHITLFK